jgi:hypothetical protein
MVLLMRCQLKDLAEVTSLGNKKFLVSL